MQTIFQGKSIRAQWNASHQLMEITWSGPSTSKEFRKASQSILEEALVRQPSRWLLDQKGMMIFPEDFDWFKEKMFPQFQPYLINSKLAIVLSSNPYGEYAMKQFLKGLYPNGHLHVFFFEETAFARQWLIEAEQGYEASSGMAS